LFLFTVCVCDCSRRGRKGQGEAAECLDGEAEDEGRTAEVISGISQDTAHGHHGRHLQLAVVFRASSHLYMRMTGSVWVLGSLEIP